MPQTAWVVDGGQRMGKGSVEEVVAEPIKEVSQSASLFFCSLLPRVFYSLKHHCPGALYVRRQGALCLFWSLTCIYPPPPP